MKIRMKNDLGAKIAFLLFLKAKTKDNLREFLFYKANQELLIILSLFSFVFYIDSFQKSCYDIQGRKTI